MSEHRDNISPAMLLNAYAQGIFPMAQSADDPDFDWYDPPIRGVLPLNEFRVPKSLSKRMRRSDYHITIDQAFDEVMQGCASRSETWINERIRELYGSLFRSGFCHSIEVWMEGRLAGGLYGVSLGAAFFGESMFSARTDASKIALVHLVARLKAGDYMLLDTQFVTKHLSRFGASEVLSDDYKEALGHAVRHTADFHRLGLDLSPQEVVQLSTQTS